MAKKHFSMTFFPLLCCMVTFFSAYAFDFEVGDNAGWIVPPSNDTQIYNQWASRNRFRVGDTLNFRYKKDSVMEVTEEEYNRCNSTQPIFFSNNGHTELKLSRSGTFYFISGVRDHCQLGQRMIIKVMGYPSAPTASPAGNQTTEAGSSPDDSSSNVSRFGFGTAMLAIGSIMFVLASSQCS